MFQLKRGLIQVFVVSRFRTGKVGQLFLKAREVSAGGVSVRCFDRRDGVLRRRGQLEAAGRNAAGVLAR